MAETTQQEAGRFAVYDETLERFVGPVGSRSDVDKFRGEYKPKQGDGSAHKTSVKRVGSK